MGTNIASTLYVVKGHVKERMEGTDVLFYIIFPDLKSILTFEVSFLVIPLGYVQKNLASFVNLNWFEFNEEYSELHKKFISDPIVSDASKDLERFFKKRLKMFWTYYKMEDMIEKFFKQRDVESLSQILLSIFNDKFEKVSLSINPEIVNYDSSQEFVSSKENVERDYLEAFAVADPIDGKVANIMGIGDTIYVVIDEAKVPDNLKEKVSGKVNKELKAEITDKIYLTGKMSDYILYEFKTEDDLKGKVIVFKDVLIKVRQKQKLTTKNIFNSDSSKTSEQSTQKSDVKASKVKVNKPKIDLIEILEWGTAFGLLLAALILLIYIITS
jgi:hypothetical protein